MFSPRAAIARREEEDRIIAEKKAQIAFVESSGVFHRISKKAQKDKKAAAYTLPLNIYDGVKR